MGTENSRTRVADPVLDALLQGVVTATLPPSEAMDYLSDYLKRRDNGVADQMAGAGDAALADAAHGAEGISVIDPYTRQLARWVAHGRMSGDEAVAFITALHDADATLREPDTPADPGYQVGTAPWGADLQGAVERGDISQPEAVARISGAFRCYRAFRGEGASGEDYYLELRDQALVELIQDVLSGKRSEAEAQLEGLRYIREKRRSDD